MKDHDQSIVDMVHNQIMRRGIRDPNVIDAMLSVKRHLFVLPKNENKAYGDHPLSIGFGQTISQPYMVALMTQVLQITDRMKVLEIGTGSGYQTAVLAELAKEVYSIERIEQLYGQANRILDYLEYKNVQLKVGDGSLGWKEQAPFDRIIVTAGAKIVPEELVNQLDIDGILVMPVGQSGFQTLYQINKVPLTKGSKIDNPELWIKLGLNIDGNYDLDIQSLDNCMFVPLITGDS